MVQRCVILAQHIVRCSLTWPPIRSIPTEDDELFENIPPEQYDLNTVIPVPQKTLETHLVRIEPMVPSLHGDALHRAFSTPGADPLFYPAGKPYTEKRQTLIYLEIQRRRTNFLLFAIIDKHSEQLAGQIAIGCDPTQTTRDIKILQVKVFPKFRRTHVIGHAEYLSHAYVLDPVSEGGLGCVRATGRVIPENIRSLTVHRKGFPVEEGTMRCYDVITPAPGDPPPKFGRITPDGRVTEDGVVFSLTIYDWLVDGIREKWKAVVDAQHTPLIQRPAKL